MPTNDFLPFANIGGADVIPQPDYVAMASRPVGFQAGVAESLKLNKVWRQSSMMSAALGKFMMDTLGVDVLDDGDVDALALKFLSAVQARTRIKLSANLNLYVSPSGNDLNNGLTVGTPFQTMQRAWQEMFNSYDLNGFSVVINCAIGTYSQQTTCVGTPSGVGPTSTITFRGNVTTPSVCIVNVALANGFSVGSCAVPVVIEGMRIIASGTSNAYVQQGHGLNNYNSVVMLNKVEFGACGTCHMNVSNGGRIMTNGNPYAIVGASPVHWSAYAGGLFIVVNSVVTITGTPAFSSAFAQPVLGGLVDAYGVTFTGSATGTRYNVNTNSVINTQGGGANYLPGNAAGFASTGGQYL